MPKISQQKKDKIAEQILAHLFQKSPEAQYTNKIAEEIIRDEEFTKSLLQDLESKKLVVKVTKGPQAQEYVRRQRWRLSQNTYDIYKKHQ